MKRVLYIIMCLTSVTMVRAQSSYKYRYWFDDDIAHAVTLTAADRLQTDISLEGLDAACHYLHVQVVDEEGIAGPPRSYMFVKEDVVEDLTHMTCVYRLDDDLSYTPATPAADGMFHLNIDVAALSDGWHQIVYAMMAEDGTLSNYRHAFFSKEPLGGNGIQNYSYWVNDDLSSLSIVHLDKLANPLLLNELFALPQQPIRSTAYHFEISDDVPYIYPCNTFHTRFYDMYGAFAEGQADYVDYSSPQAVVAEALHSGDVVTKDTPAENEIQWYYFTAKPTDSLRIQVNRACTVRVFSPSGEEVLKQTGSTKWETFTAAERGVYYLALHDVTANAQTTTLRFELIVDNAITDVIAERQNKVYSVGGVLVGSHLTKDDLQRLPTGLYIINGRKVVINANKR